MFLLLLLLLLVVLIRIPAVQTYMAQKVAGYMANEWDTEVSIGGVDIEFFNSIILEDFYIEDREGDTLLYTKKLSAAITDINLKKNEIEIEELGLDVAHFELKSYKGKEGHNAKFILELFAGTDTTKKEDWTIRLNNLNLLNSHFSYHNFNKEKIEWGIDYNHTEVSDLNGSFRNITIVKDTIETFINNLTFKEQNGLRVQKLTAKSRFDPKKMLFDDLLLQTPHSEIFAQLSFYYDSLKDFQSFNEEVKMDAVFKESLINFSDIAHFVPQLRYLKESIYLNGKVKGEVANLKGRDIEMHISKNTFFVGDFDLRGLPYVAETFIYLKVKEFKTNAKGLSQIPLPPFEEGRYLKLPDNFKQLGNISFKGNFTGFIGDFVAYGDFKSRLGNMRTDLSLVEKENRQYAYRGEVRTNGFRVGEFLEIEGLGDIRLDATIEGVGITKKDIKAKLKGTVDQLTYKGYSYNKIEVDGEITPNRFDGELTVKDRDIDLVFKGMVDGNGKYPVMDFEADLKQARLAKLRLFNVSDTVTSLSFKADFNLVGKRLDDLKGKVEIKELYYSDSLRNYEIDELNLSAFGTDSARTLQLQSDLLDGELKGDYHLNQLGLSLKEFATTYIPSASFPVKNKQELENKFRFKLYFKNTQAITELFVPSLTLDSGGTFEGKFDALQREIDFDGYFPSLKLNGIQVEGLKFSGKNEGDSLVTSIYSAKTGVNDSTYLKAIDLKIASASDQLWVYLDWRNDDKRLYEADVNLKAVFNGFTNIQMDFYDSYFVIADSLWSFDKQNNIKIDSTTIRFTNMELKGRERALKIGGTISEDSTKALDIIFKGIDLSYLNSFIANQTVGVEGVGNGNLSLRNIYKSPIITASAKLDSLYVNETYLETAVISSEWNPATRALEVSSALQKNKKETVSLSGFYYPYREEESLNLKLSLVELPTDLFDEYIAAYLSDLSGSLTGSVSLNGSLKKPLLSGEVFLNQLRLKVNYLNTYYTLNDRLIVENDWIGFNLIKVKDEKGNSAIATGTIFHENYQNFNLDIGLEMNNFLALNTTAADNSLYYGKGVVSGFTNISGYADQLIFDIDITTEKGTRFNIPLEEGTEVSRSDFLTFTNSGKAASVETDYKVDLSGIQLNFDLNVTPDAEVRLIFDEQIGDVMRARGFGNLKLEINTLGNFNMYGQYAIEEGDYLFTLQNVINKRFLLEKGGRISWNGSPYDAEIDLNAVYKLRASLYDILVDTTGNYKRRIPVELKLMMDGKLLNPDLQFDINLPTADDNAQQALQSVIYVNRGEVNQQEMNQQVFGLLVLNRFLPPSGTSAVNENYQRAGIGANSSSEFLSNQLSNWLSRLSDEFDVGIRYQPGDELSSDEVEVALSTEILNDRVVLDGNFGYSNNQYNINNQNNSGIIGEFTIEYKINKDGRFRVKGFNRSNNNSLLRTNSPYTQGLGLFYREEFDDFGELLRKYFQKSQKSTAPK